jgi:hypothetical protein
MKNIFLILVILGFAGLYSHCVLAFQPHNLSPGNIRDLKQEIAVLCKQLGDLKELHGEILAVNKDRILLIEGSLSTEVIYDDNIKVYVNGRVGQIKALCPIVDGCNFLARVWLDKNNRVVLIDGYYWGADVVVEEAVRLIDGRYYLVVRDAIIEEPIYWTFETAPNCRGLDNLSSSSLLGSCYILFDLEGKIRGLF